MVAHVTVHVTVHLIAHVTMHVPHACAPMQAGVHVNVHHLPDSVSQAQLEAAVQRLCSDPHVDGVLIQLPLPNHLCEEEVMEHIDPRKDVDGFHPLNMGWVRD